MIELFIEGGPLFMGMLTLILLINVIITTMAGASLSGREVANRGRIKYREYIKAIGLFALVTGIFGHLMGLYQAFEAIQKMGSVSPAVLMGGLKVAMIPTLYGIVIFLISYLFWFGLGVLSTRLSKVEG